LMRGLLDGYKVVLRTLYVRVSIRDIARLKLLRRPRRCGVHV
jgi:hypothetical protein